MNVISCFFTADYRDGQVYSGGKKYPAGHFTVQLMNQYYVHDTAARIAVFRDGVNGRVLEQLRDGYLNIDRFVRAGFLTEHALNALPRLTPFDRIDVDAVRDRVRSLFTEETGAAICEYFRDHGWIAAIHLCRVKQKSAPCLLEAKRIGSEPICKAGEGTKSPQD